ncbi:hypothetical protein WN943_014458 [Citrus x changshan-huyou]
MAPANRLPTAVAVMICYVAVIAVIVAVMTSYYYLHKDTRINFELDGNVQKAEYEGLPVIYFKCGRYGHNSSNCKEVGTSTNFGNVGQAQQAMPGNEAPAQQDVGRKDDDNVVPFGPWMIATRRGRKPNSGKENISDLNHNREHAGAGTSRDVRKVATKHRDRQGPDPQHLADSQDVHNISCVKEVGNAHTHPAVPMSGVDGDGMSDDEDSMVQETPLALASLLRLQKDPKLALQLFKNPNPNPNDTEAPPLKPYRYNLLHCDLTITKLGRAKMFDEMQQIFHQLKHDTRVIPEEIIFCNVISFYGRARLLEHALQVFDEMSSFNVQRTVKSLNTLLNAMLTCGKLDRMKELFQIMEKYVSPYHQLGTVCNSCCNPLLCSHCNPLLC